MKCLLSNWCYSKILLKWNHYSRKLHFLCMCDTSDQHNQEVAEIQLRTYALYPSRHWSLKSMPTFGFLFSHFQHI
jgi:hypothetical protein